MEEQIMYNLVLQVKSEKQLAEVMQISLKEANEVMDKMIANFGHHRRLHDGE